MWHYKYLLMGLSFPQLNWELFSGQNHLSVSGLYQYLLKDVEK